MIIYIGSVFNNLFSPYLAEKYGIKYSFFFGILLCGISGLSVIFMVYVDKILFENQQIILKKKSNGNLLEVLIDSSDEEEKEVEVEGGCGNYVNDDDDDIDRDKREDEDEEEEDDEEDEGEDDEEEQGREKGIGGKNVNSAAFCATLNTAHHSFKILELLSSHSIDKDEVEKEVEISCKEKQTERDKGIECLKKVQIEAQIEVEIEGEFEGKSIEWIKSEDQKVRQQIEEKDKKQEPGKENEKQKEEEEEEEEEITGDECNTKLINNLNQMKNVNSNADYEELRKNINFSKVKSTISSKLKCRRNFYSKKKAGRAAEIRQKARLSDVSRLPRSFWILTFSSVFVYGEKIDKF